MKNGRVTQRDCEVRTFVPWALGPPALSVVAGCNRSGGHVGRAGWESGGAVVPADASWCLAGNWDRGGRDQGEGREKDGRGEREAGERRERLHVKRMWVDVCGGWGEEGRAGARSQEGTTTLYLVKFRPYPLHLCQANKQREFRWKLHENGQANPSAQRPNSPYLAQNLLAVALLRHKNRLILCNSAIQLDSTPCSFRH